MTVFAVCKAPVVYYVTGEAAQEAVVVMGGGWMGSSEPWTRKTVLEVGRNEQVKGIWRRKGLVMRGRGGAVRCAKRGGWEGDQCERRRNIHLALTVLSLKWEQTLRDQNTGLVRFWLEKIPKAVSLEKVKFF